MATGSVVAVMALGSNSGGVEWLAAGTLIASAVFGVYAARRPLGKGVHQCPNEPFEQHARASPR
jgi:hypothetical protein